MPRRGLLLPIGLIPLDTFSHPVGILSRKFHGAEGVGVCCVIISLDTKGVF